MEGLKLGSLVLDLPEFLKWVHSILEHVHLLTRAEMHRRVDQGLIQSDLFLPMKYKTMSASIPVTISNPDRSNVSKESGGING